MRMFMGANYIHVHPPPYAMLQYTASSPMFVSNPSAVHTAFDPSTMLLRQGGWNACSESHPLTESHSSTTLACTLLPVFTDVILIIFRHLEPPAYHRWITPRSTQNSGGNCCRTQKGRLHRPPD
ncbi:hypothetical protein MLD38_039141 [Melastoma candidum]|uniref:Uncharacterized protein n=1 Tax=Melastoma candidum TaxID=119954 RepID=A0ACB9L1K9_9MYRT|nr:hypothetical protein MLD38_039141 [Melastoma candidum]